LRGYKSVLEANPGVKIAEVIDTRGAAATAFDKTTEIVEKAKIKPDAFVCLESVSCAEVADVLERKNVTGKVIVGMDTDPRTLQFVQKGLISATIAQKPFTMAYYGVKILDDLCITSCKPSRRTSRRIHSRQFRQASIREQR